MTVGVGKGGGGGGESPQGWGWGGGGGGGVVILLEIGLCYTNRDKLRPCDLIAWSAPLPFFYC